ncbi:MAG TPA: hypothetical protein VF669_10595 [Tepidisphaeraceae bacterium]
MIRLSLLVVAAFVCSGCGTTVNMAGWQRDVERYVRQEGRGDPNVLRDLTLDESRRGYAVAGADDPREGTDARGLLLGHKMVAGQPWYFYLVGIVKQQKVEEIHLAALSAQTGGYRWVISPKSGEALKMYRNYNEGLGKQRFPGRKQAPVDYSTFPREEDEFDLTIDGTHVTAVHKTSGAWWDVNLPG